MERGRLGPGRIVERNTVEVERAERRVGQRRRLGRRADVGLGFEQFGQPFGRAGARSKSP